MNVLTSPFDYFVSTCRRDLGALRAWLRIPHSTYPQARQNARLGIRRSVDCDVKPIVVQCFLLDPWDWWDAMDGVHGADQWVCGEHD